MFFLGHTFFLDRSAKVQSKEKKQVYKTQIDVKIIDIAYTGKEGTD